MTLLDALARYKQEPIRENEEALFAALTDAVIGSQQPTQTSDTSTAASVLPTDFQALAARVAALEAETLLPAAVAASTIGEAIVAIDNVQADHEGRLQGVEVKVAEALAQLASIEALFRSAALQTAAAPAAEGKD